MKILIRILSMAALLTLLAVPGLALAQGGEPEDRLVFGGNYTLNAGDKVRNLNVFGGNVVLAPGSTVVEHIFLYGGNLTVNGDVGEDIHVYGGQLTLNATAVVKGNISLTGGNLTQSKEARVEGQISRNALESFNIPWANAPVISVPGYRFDIDPALSRGLWYLLQTVGLSLLAALVILFAPKVTERAGDAALARPWQAGGLGLLVGIITPPLLIGFAITLIGIPVTIVLALLAFVAVTFGWIALGLEVGKRLAQAFHRDWPLVVDAGLGTLLLSLVANGIGLTPCVGWIVPTLVGFVGIGGVILSWFGTRPYPAVTPPPGPTVTPFATARGQVVGHGRAGD